MKLHNKSATPKARAKGSSGLHIEDWFKLGNESSGSTFSGGFRDHAQSIGAC